MPRVPVNALVCGNCLNRSKIPYNMHGYAWCSVLKMNVSACDKMCRDGLSGSPKFVRQRELRLAYLEAVNMASL